MSEKSADEVEARLSLELHERGILVCLETSSPKDFRTCRNVMLKELSQYFAERAGVKEIDIVRAPD